MEYRQFEDLAREEERALLEDPNVPDDVKVEIAMARNAKSR